MLNEPPVLVVDEDEVVPLFPFVLVFVVVVVVVVPLLVVVGVMMIGLKPVATTTPLVTMFFVDT